MGGNDVLLHYITGLWENSRKKGRFCGKLVHSIAVSRESCPKSMGWVEEQREKEETASHESCPDLIWFPVNFRWRDGKVDPPNPDRTAFQNGVSTSLLVRPRIDLGYLIRGWDKRSPGSETFCFIVGLVCMQGKKVIFIKKFWAVAIGGIGPMKGAVFTPVAAAIQRENC